MVLSLHFLVKLPFRNVILGDKKKILSEQVLKPTTNLTHVCRASTPGFEPNSKLTQENSLITAPPLALINGGHGKKKLFNFDYLGERKTNTSNPN